MKNHYMDQNLARKPMANSIDLYVSWQIHICRSNKLPCRQLSTAVPVQSGNLSSSE